MVIGIIAIVFGSCGMIGGVIGACTPLFTGMFKGVHAPGGGEVFAGMDKWSVWIIGLNLVGISIAAVLLAGGIGLVKGRAWSPGVTIAWAVLKILFAVPMAVVTAFMQYDNMNATIASMGRSGTPPPPGMMGGMSSGIAAFTVVFTLGWAWALPVFMLIWFTRPKHRALTATWTSNPVEVPA